jgi:SAM-dependent methyltransferase
MPEDYFGPEVARAYDAGLGEMASASVVEPAVALLAELAAGGPALEFGIGTGRVALPLAARGVRVSGVDLSEAMLAELAAKPGGASIPVVCGDFSTARVEGGPFALVYLVFNTIGNLVTQDAQVACFANAARHLAPGGHFVIEVGVPALRSLPPGERYDVFAFEDGHIGIDEYDTAAQGLVSHHIVPAGPDGSFVLRSTPFRYVWPAELDLMARLAGMHLGGRWGGWRREPFTAESRSHVSAWRLPAPDG